MAAEQEQDPPNEFERLRKEMHNERVRNDTRITQLMAIMINIQSRLPPPQQQIPDGGARDQEVPNDEHPEQPPPPENPQLAEMLAKILKLEESVAKSEKRAITGFDMSKLCIFPGAKLPKKFKHVDFEKFDGTGDPRGHIQAYVSSLSLQDVDEPAMAQMFHETLTGPALQWLLSLDISKRQTWEEMVAAFIKQYEYNVQLKVTTRELESIKMKEKESFAEFVKRWRAKTAQMTDRPSDKDQMRIITKNLQPDLAQYMVTAQAHNFETGLSIEEALQSGVLKKGDPIPKPKRNYIGNTSSLYANPNYTAGTSSNSMNHQSHKTEPINAILSQLAQPTQTFQNPRGRRVFTPLPLPLPVVFERLVQQGKIKPLQPTPPPQNPPPSYNPNTFCVFHQTPGHPTERCQRLRHEIQDLIDNKQIRDPTEKPNVVTNPLPAHKRNGNIGQITLSSTQKDQDSNPFDPSQFIVLETDPKPIVPIPDECEACFLDAHLDPTIWQEWGGLIMAMEAQEYEQMVANNVANEEVWPHNEQIIEEPPLGAMMNLHLNPMLEDPLDGFALPNLFEPLLMVQNQQPVEEGQGQNWQEENEALNGAQEDEWDPTPNEWQLMAPNDPLDGSTLPMFFDETYFPMPPLWEGRPDFSMMSEHAINRMMKGIEFTPYDYIIDENLPASQVQIPENCNIMVMNGGLPDVWEQQMQENVLANVWAIPNEGITLSPLWVGNDEVWTVNEAAMENGDVWSEETVEGITKGLEETSIAKGKRKAEGDLVDLYTDYTDLWGDDIDSVLHLLRSGRFYQPPQMYTGNTSNPSPNSLNQPPFNQTPQNNSIPLNNLTPPNNPTNPIANPTDFQTLFNPPVDQSNTTSAANSRVRMKRSQQ
ncbi:hypothetical protein Vadar_026661 [Vaccinium darrowii]|uniref:Uncharacterized protein n=1 Tax=Vaccinium darrowii TaxID=229202 RepID=A0ACB7XK50_9ERIC|nr:hypothetical protein Vadar_026661 [Vaccinium darrowii]